MSGDKLWDLLRADWTCSGCGADAAEIRATGHRRVARLDGSDAACAEVCSCIPQHRSRAEHQAEVGQWGSPDIPFKT